MNKFTVEETNLLSIYKENSKWELIKNIKTVLPYMDTDMQKLATGTIIKIDELTEAEYAELAIYVADEV